MRVSLFYNKHAGDGVPLDHIRNAIEQRGHELVRVVEKREKRTNVQRLLEERPDIVVAAGGDGTIAQAARLLARRGIPLAILPLGTANNIAKSLGITASIENVIGGWETAGRLPVDLGVAEGAWGRRYFVEAVGGGLIPTAIADIKTRTEEDELPARSKMAGAVRAVSEVLSRLQPGEWTIVADGARTTGEFLLVEVLNIRSIGPNLVFSQEATPLDGLFRVVRAGEEHREEIARYLQDLLEGRDHPPSLTSQCARQVTLQGTTDIHVDDQVLSASAGRMVSIRVEAGALELLA
jgi:diacylglycerol kinase (ATP)